MVLQQRVNKNSLDNNNSQKLPHQQGVFQKNSRDKVKLEDNNERRQDNTKLKTRFQNFFMFKGNSLQHSTEIQKTFLQVF